jgi:hypothetical protein
MSKELLEKLSENMNEYFANSLRIKEIEKIQDRFKIENLELMRQLELSTYSTESLSINVIQNHKKVGVDENALSALIGKDVVDRLKIVPVTAITNGIKDKTLPVSANNCILTVPEEPYTKITLIKPTAKVIL